MSQHTSDHGAHTPMTIQDQGEAGFVILDRNGNFYARTYSSVDARLIAAAPMLVAALEDLLGPMDKKSIDILERVKNARAAIAQAKGESNG